MWFKYCKILQCVIICLYGREKYSNRPFSCRSDIQIGMLHNLRQGWSVVMIKKIKEKALSIIVVFSLCCGLTWTASYSISSQADPNQPDYHNAYESEYIDDSDYLSISGLNSEQTGDDQIYEDHLGQTNDVLDNDSSLIDNDDIGVKTPLLYVE